MASQCCCCCCCCCAAGLQSCMYAGLPALCRPTLLNPLATFLLASPPIPAMQASCLRSSPTIGRARLTGRPAGASRWASTVRLFRPFCSSTANNPPPSLLLSHSSGGQLTAVAHGAQPLPSHTPRCGCGCRRPRPVGPAGGPLPARLPRLLHRSPPAHQSTAHARGGWADGCLEC